MEPVQVLSCEPPQAHSLDWLPLAVRFKLDAAGLKVGLAEWRVLTKEQRMALLACSAGPPFEALVLSVTPNARRLHPAECSYHDYLFAKLPKAA